MDAFVNLKDSFASFYGELNHILRGLCVGKNRSDVPHILYADPYKCSQLV